MVEKSADWYAPSFLRVTFIKLMETKKASDGKDLTSWPVVEAIVIWKYEWGLFVFCLVCFISSHPPLQWKVKKQ